MNNQIAISPVDEQAIARARYYIHEWCKAHQWEVGVAEMALGAAVLTYAINAGAIEVGKHIVASAMTTVNPESLIGAGVGGAFGGIAGQIIGSIGVAAAGTAVGIPAAVLILGGACLFGAAGYVIGDAVHAFLAPSMADMVGSASLLTVGLTLVIDGARRIIRDKRVLAAASVVKGRVIYLALLSINVVASTMAELKAKAHQYPPLARDVGTVGSAVSVTAGMAGVGSVLSAGSVSVLGSHALGAAALSIGLVSAPIWPALVAGAAGLGLWCAGYAFVRQRYSR